MIIIYRGDTSALIPLYAIGVFSAFTFSQSGMVVRWWRTRPPGWWRNLLMNLVGAIVTFTVFLVATLTKLEQGTWIVVAIVPLLMLLFLSINRHYKRFEESVAQLESVTLAEMEIEHTVIVPVSGINPITIRALAYARSISPHVTAVHIVEGEEPEEAEQFNTAWRKAVPNNEVSLVIIESPYRSLLGPLLSYIDALDRQKPDDTITIVLPEALPSRPWEYLLHGQSALRLKAALLFRPNTVVADVPFVLGRSRVPADPAEPRFMRDFPWGPVLAAAITLALVYYLFIGSR